MLRTLQAVAAAATLLAISACGGSKETPVAEAAAAPVATAPAPTVAAGATAEATLRNLYATYKDEAGAESVSPFGPDTADQWLSPEFAAIVKAAYTRKEGTDWPLDADPVINGQDFGQVSVTSVETTETGPGKAKAVVKFSNFGAPATTTFMMSKTGERWLIDDVMRPDYEVKSLKTAFSTAGTPG